MGLGGFHKTLIFFAVLYALFSLYKLYFRYDISRKYDHAMAQCEKYGGPVGQIPVVTEGVYDQRPPTGVKDILRRASVFINSGLTYVEFDSENVGMYRASRYQRNGPYYKTGRQHFSHYRVYITERNDPLCHAYETLLEEGAKTFDAAGLSGDECVAIQGFDDPLLLKAPYELVVTEKIIDEGTPVEWNNLEIVERDTKRVTAAFNTFSHCFTKMATHQSEGFGYCVGIYGNPKVRPKCPADYAKDARVVNTFEKSAFSFKRNK